MKTFKPGDIVVSDPEHLRVFYRVEVLNFYYEGDYRIDGRILECESGSCYKAGDVLSSISTNYFQFEGLSPYEQLLVSLDNLESKLCSK